MGRFARAVLVVVSVIVLGQSNLWAASCDPRSFSQTPDSLSVGDLVISFDSLDRASVAYNYTSIGDLAARVDRGSSGAYAAKDLGTAICLLSYIAGKGGFHLEARFRSLARQSLADAIIQGAPGMIRIVNDKSERNRRATAEALEGMQQAIWSHDLDYTIGDIAHSIREALKGWGEEENRREEAREASRARAERNLAKKATASVLYWSERLRDPDIGNRDRREALVMLARVDLSKAREMEPGFINEISAIIDDWDEFKYPLSSVRDLAINLLEEMGEEAAPAVPVLIRIVESHGNAWIIYQAIGALKGMGAKARSAIPALKAAKKHEDGLVRSAASRALKAIKKSRAK